MTVFATTYIGEPDIPAGLTISEYRRSRPRCTPWCRRILVRTLLAAAGQPAVARDAANAPVR